MVLGGPVSTVTEGGLELLSGPLHEATCPRHPAHTTSATGQARNASGERAASLFRMYIQEE